VIAAKIVKQQASVLRNRNLELVTHPSASDQWTNSWVIIEFDITWKICCALAR
jgi:hypothetical protein